MLRWAACFVNDKDLICSVCFMMFLSLQAKQCEPTLFALSGTPWWRMSLQRCRTKCLLIVLFGSIPLVESTSTVRTEYVISIGTKCLSCDNEVHQSLHNSKAVRPWHASACSSIRMMFKILNICTLNATLMHLQESPLQNLVANWMMQWWTPLKQTSPWHEFIQVHIDIAQRETRECYLRQKWLLGIDPDKSHELLMVIKCKWIVDITPVDQKCQLRGRTKAQQSQDFKLDKVT